MEKEELYGEPKCSEGHSIPKVMETAADRRAEEGWAGKSRTEGAVHPNTKISLPTWDPPFSSSVGPLESSADPGLGEIPNAFHCSQKKE